MTSTHNISFSASIIQENSEGFDDPQDYHDENPEPIQKTKQPRSAGKNAAERLVLLAMQSAELWHDRSIGWGSVTVDGHEENYRIKSATFRGWLASTYFDSTGTVANEKAVASAIEIVNHQARKGPTHKPYLRWAKQEEKIYCDLGTPEWDAVEIDRNGWRVIPTPPVKFRRTGHTAPMPYPVSGGSLDLLRPLVASTDIGWVLIHGYMIDACKGYGPYLVCSINGEQGSAKSTTCRIIRRMIDPVIAGELSGLAKDESDFGVQAQHEHILAYDNVSWLKPEMSDVLCRASTGGGVKTRRLYTDDEISILPICCPILMNGIPDIATANDLISRTVIVHQPTIAEENRKEEKELNKQFAEVWPRAFGSLLDHLSRGLRELDQVKLSSLPRMADSIRWITACRGNHHFYEVHRAAENENIAQALENSPVARLLREMVVKYAGNWQGTATELMDEMQNVANEHGAIGRLPESAKGWAGAVRREAPTLRKAWKWDVTEGIHEGRNIIKFRVNPT